MNSADKFSAEFNRSSLIVVKVRTKWDEYGFTKKNGQFGQSHFPIKSNESNQNPIMTSL